MIFQADECVINNSLSLIMYSKLSVYALKKNYDNITILSADLEEDKLCLQDK